MPVYVDAGATAFRRMKMAHMLADTEPELHEMADRIGLKREWFQIDGGTPHYDICQSKRKKALELGATEINRNEVVALIRRLRNAHNDKYIHRR